jgi:glycosyltransferase involved in cell wall biosynthesis
MPSNQLVTPLITTVIPTYRRPQLLRRAIRSALNQTYKNIRVCIYDDASGDETKEVVRSLAEDDARIEYHCHTENIGAPANWDYGMRQVKTPYYSMLSDDDVLLPTFYERALSDFEKYPSAMAAVGNTVYIGPNHTWLGSSTRDFSPGLYTHPEGLIAMSENPQPAWNGALFRRETLERVGTLDTSLYSMDYDFVLRLAAVCPYTIFHDVVGLFTAHPGSSTAILQLHMVWPTRFAAMQKVAADERIAPEVRRRTTDLLTKDLRRMLFYIGLRSLTFERFEECRETAAILRTRLGAPLRGRALRASSSSRRAALVACAAAEAPP